MPTITIKFFGPARDLAAAPSITLPIAAGDTVGHVAAKIAEQVPALASALGLRLAVNRAYVPLNHVLADGDEMAVIPPVSGGTTPPLVALTREPIVLQSLIEKIADPLAGAAASFLGTVRAEQHEGQPLIALEYHAYEEMALEQMQDIRLQALKKFTLIDVAIIHRLGRVDVGHPSIVVIAQSEHRPAAFDACREIVDQIKTDVPIWKKDIWQNGTTNWTDTQSCP